MVQLEPQFLPAVIGALLYFLYRIMFVRVPPRGVPAVRTEQPARPVQPRPQETHDRSNTSGSKLGRYDNRACSSCDTGSADCAEPNPEPAPELDREVAVVDASVDRLVVSACIALTVSCILIGMLSFYAFQSAAIEAPVYHTFAADAPPDYHDELVTLQTQSHIARKKSKIDRNTTRPAAAHESLLPDCTSNKDDGEWLQPSDIDDSAPMGRVMTLELKKQSTQIRTEADVVYYKSAYWGTIQVGTPAVPFNVVFDTGSGMLILPSSWCRSQTCREHQRYRKSKSFSGVDIDGDGTPVKPGDPRDQISVSFGTGDVTGVFVEETICMDDLFAFHNEAMSSESAGSRQCVRLRMIAATEMSNDPFRDFGFDGVLGLGLTGLAQAPAFSFLSVMAHSAPDWGATNGNTFGVFLAEHDEETSAITFGGWAEEKVNGSIVWNQVYEPEHGHWLLEIKRIYVNDHRVDFCEDGNCRAVMDTGTSLVAVPSASFVEIFQLLRHRADADGGCVNTGPKLHFEFEASTVTLESKDYARLEEQQRVSDRTWPEYTMKNENKSEQVHHMYCKPLLMTMDIPEPIGPKLFILGEPVLRKYYTVYDARPEGPRIGIALATHPPMSVDFAGDDGADESWFYDEQE